MKPFYLTLLLVLINTSLFSQNLSGAGTNTNGELGIGLSGTGVNRDTLVQAGGGGTFISVDAGYDYSVAMKADHSVWIWGHNGTVNNVAVRNTTPVLLNTDLDWATYDAGYHDILLIKNNGTLWIVQTNFGALSITQVGTATNWAKVASGFDHYLAIKTDGTLWAWGSNNYGQMGTGGSNSGTNSLPVQVGLASNWASISADVSCSMAIKTDGTLWGWGRNGNGQLGTGNTTTYQVPTQVGTDTNWSSITIDETNTAALKTDGTIWTWGKNSFGELGDGSSSSGRKSPLQVGTATDWTRIAVGYEYTIALKSNGTIWGTGLNTAGVGTLGLGQVTRSQVFVQLSPLTNWTGLAGGYQFTLYLGPGLTTAVSNTSPLPTTVGLYPNPSGDRIHLLSNTPLISLTIYNTTGKVLRQGTGNSLYIGDLPSGYYFCIGVDRSGRSIRASFVRPD